MIDAMVGFGKSTPVLGRPPVGHVALRKPDLPHPLGFDKPLTRQVSSHPRLAFWSRLVAFGLICGSPGSFLDSPERCFLAELAGPGSLGTQRVALLLSFLGRVGQLGQSGWLGLVGQRGLLGQKREEEQQRAWRVGSTERSQERGTPAKEKKLLSLPSWKTTKTAPSR